MSSQLDRWTGEFGTAYTDRNVVDWRTRVEGFRQMIPSDVQSVLDVGANRGHNLRALREVLPNADLAGLEPARYARKQALEQGLSVYKNSIYEMAGFSNDFDLVMTSGVLIHVPPEYLDEALSNVHLAARRYILAIEYHANQDTEIEYRGHKDMLWKRDYGAHYLRLFPDLTLVGTGDDSAGFERARYWLLQK